MDCEDPLLHGSMEEKRRRNGFPRATCRRTYSSNVKNQCGTSRNNHRNECRFQRRRCCSLEHAGFGSCFFQNIDCKITKLELDFVDHCWKYSVGTDQRIGIFRLFRSSEISSSACPASCLSHVRSE